MLVPEREPKCEDFCLFVIELVVLMKLAKPLLAARLEIPDVGNRGAGAQLTQAEVAPNRLGQPAAIQRGKYEVRKRVVSTPYIFAGSNTPG